jgi:hypothetical protein
MGVLHWVYNYQLAILSSGSQKMSSQVLRQIPNDGKWGTARWASDLKAIRCLLKAMGSHRCCSSPILYESAKRRHETEGLNVLLNYRGNYSYLREQKSLTI